MFLLPILYILFSSDSMQHIHPGLSLGTGLPFGGNGLQSEILYNTHSTKHLAFTGGLGISLGGSEIEETDYYFINNYLGIQWERGQRHRLLLSAGLVSSNLMVQRPAHPNPERKFVAGPCGSAGYCLRTKRGFHFQAGMSLVLIQNPMENSPAFHLNPAPFAGLGWSWEKRGR
jgi:hypothetical protein